MTQPTLLNVFGEPSSRPWAGHRREPGNRTVPQSAAVREYSKSAPARARDSSWDLPPEEVVPEYMTAAQASRLIGPSRSLVGAWVRRGRLEPVGWLVAEGGGPVRRPIFRSVDVIALYERSKNHGLHKG